jgi:peptidoglycan/LPS O-acetylase OafA/YrhL
MSLKKIQGLDALRAIAVLFVIITHWGPHSFKNFPALTFFFEKSCPRANLALTSSSY